MNDPNTHLTDEQLSTLIDDRLEALERETVSLHLAQCDACNQSLQELTYTVQALRTMLVPALPRSFQIIESPKPSLRSRLLGWTVGLPGLAAAAAALFVVLLTVDMTAMTSSSGIVPIAPAVQSRASVATQKVQPTIVTPYAAAPASAGSSASAPAPPPAGAAAGRESQPVSDQGANASEAARLEALTARDAAANAAAPARSPSPATIGAGLLAVLLILFGVVRRLRTARAP
jgi:hypothetical protein